MKIAKGLRWLLVWAAATALLAGALWLSGTSARGDVHVAGTLARGVSAAAWLICAPVLGAMRIFLGPEVYSTTLLQSVGAGIGAGLWCGVVRVLAAVRAWLGASRAPATGGAAERPSRRRFLVDGAAVAVAAPSAAMLATGTLATPWDLRLVKYRVAIRDLPRELDGLRIAQIADTHLGRFVPEEFIAKAVGMAIDLKPDVVALTGDYVYGGVAYIDRSAELFRVLGERLPGVPVVGVLGNHDWYADGRRMRAALEGVGVRMLDNAQTYLDATTRRLVDGVDAPERALCLAGVGDMWTDRVDLSRALAGVPSDMPCVLLAHNPDTAELSEVKASRGPRVDLMLSGHTHGGQVRLPLMKPWFVPSRYGAKYEGGVVQGPRFRVVVSRGVGLSLAPMRLGVPPEVLEITLVREA